MRRMAGTRLVQWLNILVWALVLLKTEGANVSITIVEDAVAKGAGKKSLARQADQNWTYILFFSKTIHSSKSLFQYVLKLDIWSSLSGWKSASLSLG